MGQGENIPLPAGSPVADWKEARRFAGPLPFTFTYDAAREQRLIIEGVRENWKPVPVTVIEHQLCIPGPIEIEQCHPGQCFLSSGRFPIIGKKVKLSNGRIKKKKVPGRLNILSFNRHLYFIGLSVLAAVFVSRFFVQWPELLFLADRSRLCLWFFNAFSRVCLCV
jgi:hypothetical protein